ncbi:carboxy-terminal kinesin 2-like isoform X2 [Ostrea edulis]|uniref:carboxy-terminal kinesin 2-like isoform X2 n=1 Tax=Ostrea edulis TaxID=37623 RepID=UPI0024AEDF55|nr:carboxy-terminal kinesin 2-like isoform X2 [Ostrea edulis]
MDRKIPVSTRSRLPTFSAKKRARSPDENSTKKVATEKRRKLLSASTENLNDRNTHSASNTSLNHSFRPSNSTGSLRSTSNLNKTTTAVVRPTTKPAPKSSVGSATKTSVVNKKPPISNSVPKVSGTKAKRPAWDLKGRLQDMEELLNRQSSKRDSLESQLQDYNNRIASLESEKKQLYGDVQNKEEIVHGASKQIEEYQKQIRDQEINFDQIKRKLQADIDSVSFSRDSLQRQKESLEGEISVKTVEVTGLRSTVAELQSAQIGIAAQLDATKMSLEQSVSAGVEKDKEIADLKQQLADMEAQIENYKIKDQEHETMRRKLHNTIQELKGNIRVFCRVRPLLGDELLGNDGTVHHMAFPDTDGKLLELEKMSDATLNESCLTANRKGNNKYEFTFDKVFNPDSTQGQVFEEICQLVQSALDGYNVCIFAYGQTGSGKTYTMEGPSQFSPDQTGMIPRAVVQIFTSTQDLVSKGWQYEFEASFLEIYNETIRDLLGNNSDDLRHDIKMTGSADKKDVTVTNLTTVTVTSESQVHELLRKASHNRAVAETKCNERSSRSHSVFRLRISGVNKHTKEVCQGTLNLVDLAGSERLKESGSEGARLKETQAINKSLSTLSKVIMAIANKDGYIPYRESKLTYLLQNSLGGNSKTLMFVNVSPREECFQETLNSLRFATKVNQCNIGTAQKKLK